LDVVVGNAGLVKKFDIAIPADAEERNTMAVAILDA
jgi:hypothetical protein